MTVASRSSTVEIHIAKAVNIYIYFPKIEEKNKKYYGFALQVFQYSHQYLIFLSCLINTSKFTSLSSLELVSQWRIMTPLLTIVYIVKTLLRETGF